MPESHCTVGGSLRQKFMVADSVGNHLRVASTHLCRSPRGEQAFASYIQKHVPNSRIGRVDYSKITIDELDLLRIDRDRL